MLLGELIITGAWGWGPLVVAWVLVLVLLGWSYRGSSLGALSWVCAGCKAVGILLLVFCLLEPIWSGQRARPGANVVAVVADNSESLQVRDRGDVETRAAFLRAALEDQAGSWQRALEDAFDVRRYQFDRRVRSVANFEGLDFVGRTSDLHAALADVAERLAGRPVAGLLVLTDGNATDLAEALGDRSGLPPIFPVVLGHEGGVRDLSIAAAQVTQTAFEDAPVSIRVEVQAVGFRGREVEGRLVDREGQVIKSLRATVRSDPDTVVLQFDFRGESAGAGFYQVNVGLAQGLVPAGNEETEEATLANNTRAFVVDHGQGPHRILYVSGRPNWEFKFLNRALQEDDQLQLVALIRVALREPKFSFRGRAGESSNPLYRGFGDQSLEDVERYDQPVLTRWYTRDEEELSVGFPLTPEDLFVYEGVILDDVEAAFFTVDQANLLRRFVSERGGGLLMLGGAESFREGGYDRSPIGELLPVYLDQPPKPVSRDETVKWDLSHEGWLEAWARLRSSETAERDRLSQMPPFQVLNRTTGGGKPGASVLASVEDARGEKWPALVTQRFGRGRVGTVLVGDLWRWGRRGADEREDLNQAWRQMARWLVADVPVRAEVAAAPSVESSQAVELQTRVRDAAFEPVDDATVTLEVQGVGWGEEVSSTAVRLRAEASPTEPGLYQVTFMPRERGAYRVTASVTNAAGAPLHRVESGWATDAVGEEFASLEPNVALLEALARDTGGELVPVEDLADFVARLPARSAPVMESWSAPAWHTPWLFALALALFVTEWGFRRWKGLP